MTTNSYPGGKSGDGVYQRIINQIPPHATYAELFLGGGAIARYKRHALTTIVMDRDESVIKRWQVNPYNFSDYTAICGDALEWLDREGRRLDHNALVYLDPPYLAETRATKGRIYKYEMTDDDHRRLLSIIAELKCKVAISGYWSLMYNDVLRSWRAITYQARTRKGEATEYLWMNYPQPKRLHDYRYLGEDFRERQRIKRKKARWTEKLANMPPGEMFALMSAIEELDRKSASW